MMMVIMVVIAMNIIVVEVVLEMMLLLVKGDAGDSGGGNDWDRYDKDVGDVDYHIEQHLYCARYFELEVLLFNTTNQSSNSFFLSICRKNTE